VCFDDLPVFIHGDPVDLLAKNGKRSDVDEVIAGINESIASCGGPPPKLLFIDTLNRNFGGGNENASEDMTAFNRGCDLIRIGTGCTVVPIHHTGWADADRPRGHTSLPAAADTQLSLRNSDGRIKMRLVRLHGGRAGDTFTFSLKETEVISPSTGDPVPVIVLEAETSGRPAPKKQMVLRVLRDAGATGHSSAEWQRASIAAGVGETTYKEAKKRLVEEGSVKQIGDRFVAIV
jgi:hypothetical protein